MRSGNCRWLSGKRSRYSKPFAIVATLAWVLAFSGHTSLTSAETLIGEGDAWRYFKGRSSAPPHRGGRDWTEPDYDDSTGWGGPAPSGFGYGDGDDATEFGDMWRSYTTLYVRRTFTVPDPSEVKHLTLAADYDDGFVAYLNGREVVRRNLPGGIVRQDTKAIRAREASRGDGGADPQEREFLPIDPGTLRAGTNVLAVSGHNVSRTSSDFSLAIALYANVNLVRGPYLQRPSADGLTVVWDTDAATDGSVDFGRNRDYRDGTVTERTPKRHHAVTLEGLDPGTQYFYRVRSGGVTLSEGKVLRSPSAPNQPHRFVVIGDFGYHHAATKKIAQQVERQQPHWLLTVGDNVYLYGQPGSYDDFWFRPYAATMARAPTFPALGNHDILSENGRWFREYFHLPENGPTNLKERNYSLDYANVHLAVIESNAFQKKNRSEMDAIAAWLEADLAATSQPWKLVTLHHPLYTSRGSHGSTALARERLGPIFERAGVQLVFQGHNHFYERLNPVKGVHYVTVGAGGMDLHEATSRKNYSAAVMDKVHSFVLVDVRGEKLTLKGIDEDGSEFDALHLDLENPFVMDGLLDEPAWQRASHGLNLYAAIHEDTLYVAVQDAGEGSDHFIFLADRAGPTRRSAWNKRGGVMAWSAFLADEDGNGFHGWFDGSEKRLKDPLTYRSMTPGESYRAGAAAVLEGTIDLRKHFGAVPEHLYIAAAPYKSPDRGRLVAAAQVPAGDDDGDLEENEFLRIRSQDLVVDSPPPN